MHQRPVITVGPREADLIGSDNRVLQAAVDRLGALGGGVVEVRPGTYLMHDSLHLRSGVVVRGAGPPTILRKAPCVRSALAADLGYGHFDVSVADPDRFHVGMGVHITDDRAGGFYGTQATLVWRQGDRFGLSRMLNHDYARQANGRVRTLFPVISAYYIQHAGIQDLVIDGQAAANEPLDGCRGGGVFLLQSHDVFIRGVTVRDYHGDGISFQQCRRTLIEDCLCEANRGAGLHPGSGSVGPIMRRVTCRRNGGDGLFYCLRVSFSLTEACTLVDNGHDGLSIGGRDTDHLIRGNRIEGNGRHGVYWRAGDLAMAGHRCRLEHNTIRGNCTREGVGEIAIDGDAQDIHLVRNRVVSRARPTGRNVALFITSPRCQVVWYGNRVQARRPIRRARGVPTHVVSLRRPPAPLAVGPEAVTAEADLHLGPTADGAFPGPEREADRGL